MGWRGTAAPGAAPPPTNRPRLSRGRAGRWGCGARAGIRQVQRGARPPGAPAAGGVGEAAAEARCGGRPGSPAARRLGAVGARGRAQRWLPRPPGLARAPRPWHDRGRRAASGRPASRNGPRAAGRPRRGPEPPRALPASRPGRAGAPDAEAGPRLRPRGACGCRGHLPGLPGSPLPRAPRPPGLAMGPGGGHPGSRAPLPESCPRRSARLPTPAPPAPARTGLSRSRCAARCR